MMSHLAEPAFSQHANKREAVTGNLVPENQLSVPHLCHAPYSPGDHLSLETKSACAMITSRHASK